MKTVHAGRGRGFAIMIQKASDGDSLYLGLLSILALWIGFTTCYSKLKLLYDRKDIPGHSLYRTIGFCFTGLSVLPLTAWMLLIEKNKPVPNFTQNLIICLAGTYSLLAVASLAAHFYGKSHDGEVKKVSVDNLFDE
ncbi:MAG: hypothetical protein ACKO85_20605 [Isosphaeraceae bacterium]